MKSLFIIFFLITPIAIIASNKSVKTIDSTSRDTVFYDKHIIILTDKNTGQDTSEFHFKFDPETPLIIDSNNNWEKFSFLATLSLSFVTFIIGIWNIRNSRKNTDKSNKNQIEVTRLNNQTQIELKNKEIFEDRKKELIEKIVSRYANYIELLQSVDKLVFTGEILNYNDRNELNKLLLKISIQNSIITLLLNNDIFSSINKEIEDTLDSVYNCIIQLTADNKYDMNGEEHKKYIEEINSLNEAFKKINLV